MQLNRSNIRVLKFRCDKTNLSLDDWYVVPFVEINVFFHSSSRCCPLQWLTLASCKVDERKYSDWSQGMRQRGCMSPQVFGTSPFAPADFEASSTMCTRCFETQSSPGCTCTRRFKFLTHSLKMQLFGFCLFFLIFEKKKIEIFHFSF